MSRIDKKHDIIIRLQNAIHLESAVIAPQTSELIEAAREAIVVIKELRLLLTTSREEAEDYP